jgi:ribosomal protein S18 acetylase RimI-like enzyme
MNIKKNKKLIIAVCLLLGLAAGTVWVYKQSQSVTSELVAGYDIRPFNAERDTDFIKQQNYDNWYLLHATPEYDLDFMLEKSSPYAWEPRTYGKLKTVVLFDEGKPAGFVNYYTRGKEGVIFLLSVDKNARGKGFGKALFGYAVEGLKKQGAKILKVSVRSENEQAQRVYRGAGFSIETSDDGFHFYRLDV